MIRRATPDDAQAIAEVHVASWDAAYRGLIPDEIIDARTVDARTQMWQEAFAGNATILVLDEDGVLGFASVGPSEDPFAEGAGELYALYLHADVWSTGRGRQLHDAALDALRTQGFTEAILWVLDTNDRGRRFYERAGWSPDGSEKHDHLGTEVRYRRSL